MREALRRERGFMVLALVCAALAVIAGLRAGAALDHGTQVVEGFKPPASALIDVNSCDALLLTSLPGIGEKTAQRIIDGRPYESVEDLRRVEGIGEKTLEGIRERICVGD
ncbi:MAG: ComEA family DNA-binding protein [Candidatus Fimadaptatus sp.]